VKFGWTFISFESRAGAESPYDAEKNSPPAFTEIPAPLTTTIFCLVCNRPLREVARANSSVLGEEELPYQWSIVSYR